MAVGLSVLTDCMCVRFSSLFDLYEQWYGSERGFHLFVCLVFFSYE